MKRREPDDPGWLALDSYRASVLDPAHLLGWIVDDAGRYDTLSPYDYSELMLDFVLGAGRTDAKGAVSFLDKLYPGKGQAIYDDRAQRIANIKVIRTPQPGAFRKAPGAQPVASGPPTPADLG